MSLDSIMDNTMLELLLTDEQNMFRKVVRKFCKNEIYPKAREWGYTDGFCWPYFKKLAEVGFLGICVPEEYGGSGGTILDLAILTEELSRTGMGIPLTHMSSPATVISKFGTEVHKKKYLPLLASGEKVFCYAQTEPNAGSDVAAMETTAVLDGDYYVINGRKCFITNSPVGSLFVLLAKTDKSLPGTKGISVFIVEKEFEGFSFGTHEKKMGRKIYPMAELILENCRVPAENIIVKHGDGFKKMMNEFNGERVGNTSMCVGYAWGAIEKAIEHAKQRVVSGQTLDKFQGIQWMFADMVCQLQSARFLLYNAAIKFSRGENVASDSAIAKAYANEMAQKVINDCMQIMGGYGYMEDYEVERYYRDARGLGFGGGTTQILRNRIARELFR